MRRLLGALLIAAWPASAQVAMVGAPCQITDGSCAGTFARLPAPSGCTTGSVAVFLGSLTCVPGLTYDAATDTLSAYHVTTPRTSARPDVGLAVSAQAGIALARPDAWAVYDAGSTSGLDAKRFWGAVFDGRFVYYIPGGGSGVTGASGVFLRYDTTAAYSDSTAWVGYDASAIGGLNTTGYAGGAFDGRYLYFAPDRDSTDTTHGRVLRYDTRGSFTSAAAWESYDASATGSLDCRGYRGAIFDGSRYVYFAPFRTSTDLADYHGRVLRYDTTGSFSASGSWSVYDAGAEHGSGSKGYKGIVSDGRYLYFVPNNNNGAGQYAIVLRYDTTGAFGAAGSWDAIDAQAVDGLVTEGYSAGVFDGRYLYFVPIGNSSTMHGRVLRYDTHLPFLSLTSWSAYDAGGASSQGFVGGVFDGRYVTLIGYYQGIEGSGGEYHGTFVRYDTTRGFKESAAWERYDASATGGLTCKGYSGAAWDGRYIYAAPHYDGSATHGRALRFDTGTPATARSETGSRWIGTRQEIPIRKVLTDATATEVFEVALAAGDMIGSGGMYSGTVTITATEGTNVQIGLDRATWTATRTLAGAQACGVVNLTTSGSALSGAANSTGTLGSYGWSCDVATAGKVILSYRADSSLTSPTVVMTGVVTVDGPNAVTLK